MASTLLQLVCLVQLVPLAFCITNTALQTKDVNEDDLETDLDTQETGWIIQEKAKQLEHLKNKILSPLTVLKPPSHSYGGGYPSYTSSASIQPSYSVGIGYPSYSSGWSGSNSFKKYPVNYLNNIFNKGSYIQNKYNYAPDCYYQTPTKPTSKFPVKPTYSYGTPLSYYYNNIPSVTYGTSNFGFSSQASFTSENNKQSQFQPSSPSGPFLVKSSIFPPATFNSGASYPLPSYPSSNPSLPSPSTPVPIPSAPPTTPEVPYSPSYTPSGSFGSKAYPGSPSWSPASYSTSPLSAQSSDTSTPVPPLWSGVTPTFPSSSLQPQYPSTPSPPWSSIGGSTPSIPVGQQYIVIPSSSHSQSPGQDIAVPKEVLITPSPLQTSDNIGTSSPGTKSVLLDEQSLVNSEPPYAISYYPNVFYISNGQYIGNYPPIQSVVVSEQSNKPPLPDVAITPVSSTSSNEEDSTPSTRAEPSKSEGLVQPVLTNIYSSNTIDQTRIPVFPQAYVPTYGATYSHVPQVVPYTYPVPYSFGFRGSLGLHGSTYKSLIGNSQPASLGVVYGGDTQGILAPRQLAPIIQKTC